MNFKQVTTHVLILIAKRHDTKECDQVSMKSLCSLVHMTSLCSTAAPDCSTGQSKGRYPALNPNPCCCLIVIQRGVLQTHHLQHWGLGPRIEGGEREVGNFLISIIIILFRASSNLRKPSFLSSIFIFFPIFMVAQHDVDLQEI